MVRTQIQLTDDLYRRVKQFGAEREMSLAEITRRAIELLLARYPGGAAAREVWRLPRIDGGGIKVPLARLRATLTEDEAKRPVRRRAGS